jgi:hypothetical protein
MQDQHWLEATKPTRFTLFLRTFLPYQFWRFLRINLKMLSIIHPTQSRGIGYYSGSAGGRISRIALR